MLDKLEILNGEISPEYNKNNYEYEVSVGSDVLTLIFNYDLPSDLNVTIYNNTNLLSGDNHVYFEVSNNEKTDIYTFLVHKEKVVSVTSTVVDNIEDKSIDKNIRIPLISAVTFLLILMLFCIIFKRKK